MPSWSAPQRPAAYAIQALITSILDGDYPPGSTLPAERELSIQLGVTRPTLREALRRLESDGWLTVQQGKPTRVRDFWREGGLNVLSGLVRYGKQLPSGFVTQLLEVRLVMAPAYTRSAVARCPGQVAACLEGIDDLPDTPEALAALDWKLHYTLTVASGNPIYTLILNGFAGFYEQMARLYFASPESRQLSRQFYQELSQYLSKKDAQSAETLTRSIMEQSIRLWEKTGQEESH
jgi:GntR family negative regulator for fad regulon and positive regulator of fabA